MNTSVHRFNHKTAAEDVHFTCVSSNSESDTDTEIEKDTDQENERDDEPINHDSHSEREYFSGGSDLELSSSSGDEPTYMEMIIIKDVKAGAEVRTSFCLLFLNNNLLYWFLGSECDLNC